MAKPEHWADVLPLRDELVDRHGQLAELQMSLYSAVYRDRAVPYRDVAHYGDITEPTHGLVGFMADIARAIGSSAPGYSLFHLDQGMGGGKSHALVGLWHLAHDPDAFFGTQLGDLVAAEAQARASDSVELSDARVVILSADHVSPRKQSAEYGPALTLFERFLWRLFDEDQDQYGRFANDGPNKATLRRALEEVDRPVLILLDELMDYVQELSDEDNLPHMPHEQAFLNALMDAVNEVPRVAFVVVMIRSDYDDRGYNDHADGFRDYITARLDRNGTNVTVTDAADFQAIIRRRLFKWPQGSIPVFGIGEHWKLSASSAWVTNVFDSLGSSRALPGFAERAAQSYPFHPDLMALVRDEWANSTGFQRVRSTVRIFAASAYHWAREHQAGRWAPALIGVGDVPLGGPALDAVLSSGLLRDERAIQSFRQVAAYDVVGKSGQGRAAVLERKFRDDHPHLDGLGPTCERIATALFLYSLVPRAQAKRGATKAELLASIYEPDRRLAYTDADEAHGLLTGDEEGLGALDIIHGSGGNTPTRYMLSITRTLRMYVRQARAQLRGQNEIDDFIWERVKANTTVGRFDATRPIEAPADPHTPLAETFARVDERASNRLVILDPRRWSLLNGRDDQTRRDIRELLGLKDDPGSLSPDFAASCVVACVNTQRRDKARRRAGEALAYRNVVKMLDSDDELRFEAERKFKELRDRLDDDVRGAFQQYLFLTRVNNRVEVADERFESETKTSLSGFDVWDALDHEHKRAVSPGGLSGSFLTTVMGDDLRDRSYTVKEIVSRFWNDPRFPFVPSMAEVRKALFEAITEPDASTHRPAWEIVTGDGEVLTIDSPEAIAVNSIDHVIRLTSSTAADEDPGPIDVPDDDITDGGGTRTEDLVFKRYTIRLPRTDVKHVDGRTKVKRLLGALEEAFDDAGERAQLVELTISVTAVEGSLATAEDAVARAGAQWREEEEF
jgi:hypothetical protein